MTGLLAAAEETMRDIEAAIPPRPVGEFDPTALSGAVGDPGYLLARPRIAHEVTPDCATASTL